MDGLGPETFANLDLFAAWLSKSRIRATLNSVPKQSLTHTQLHRTMNLPKKAPLKSHFNPIQVTHPISSQ